MPCIPGDRRSQEIDSSGSMLGALIALKKRGLLGPPCPLGWTGIGGKVADTFNEVIELNERMAKELERISRVVGKEGRINQRASLGAVSGSWEDSIDSVNALIGDLVHPTSETARVIGAVAQGDLSQSDGGWTSTTARSRASSSRRPRPSTRWSISSARSRRR